MQFRNLLLSAMPAADMGKVFPHMGEVSLNAGDAVLKPGEPVQAVVFPGSAVLSAVTAMQDGQSVETTTIGHEGAAGLMCALTGAPVRSLIFTQIPGSAVRIEAAALRACAIESPRLMELILRTVQANQAQVEQSVACNALHEATPRLARWLLMTQDRTGRASFPLRQDYLAIMVGVQRTTISAAAKALKTAGLIRYTRGLVEILDRPGLEAASCECYEAVRRRHAELGLRMPGPSDGGD